MKHEDDESGIMVFDMREEHPSRGLQPPIETVDNVRGDLVSSDDQGDVGANSMTLLGGLAGKVYDKLTYRTIEDALVAIAKGLSVKTDEKGIFLAADIEPGMYRITVSQEGYVSRSRKCTVVAGETTQLESFHLIPICLAADYPDAAGDEEEEKPPDEHIVQVPTEVMAETPSGETLAVPDEEIQAPSAEDSKELVVSEPEEVILVDDAAFDDLPQTSPENNITEVAELEETPEAIIADGPAESPTPFGPAEGTEELPDDHNDDVPAEETTEASSDEIALIAVEEIDSHGLTPVALKRNFYISWHSPPGLHPGSSAGSRCPWEGELLRAEGVALPALPAEGATRAPLIETPATMADLTEAVISEPEKTEPKEADEPEEVKEEEIVSDDGTDDGALFISDEEKEAAAPGNEMVEVAGFVGVMKVQPNPVYQGVPINIVYSLTNVACDDPGGLTLQIALASPDTGVVQETFEAPVECKKGESAIGGFVISTASHEVSLYRINMLIVSEKTETSHLLATTDLEIKALF